MVAFFSHTGYLPRMDTSRNRDDDSRRSWELLTIKNGQTKALVADGYRAAREEAGLTQAKVAKTMLNAGHTTWTRPKVAAFETGRYNLKLEEAWALSILYGRSIEDFLPPIKLTPELYPQRPHEHEEAPPT